ncbi:MAG: hypothetical protein ACRCYY_01900 [Trueperaceae bacterium]
MRRFLVVLLFLLGFSYGQSLWLEMGVGYLEILPDGNERPNQSYDSGFKFGARFVAPVTPVTGLYIAPFLQDGFNIDAGLWFTLPLTIEDIEGFRSYVGTGLTFTGRDPTRFGLALSGALTYDLSKNVALALTYTHRPLFTPRLSQAFDVSVGLKFDLR